MLENSEKQDRKERERERKKEKERERGSSRLSSTIAASRNNSSDCFRWRLMSVLHGVQSPQKELLKVNWGKGEKEGEREREEEGEEMNNLLVFIVALPKELFYKFIGNN